MDRPEGIAGLRHQEPIGAALSVGRKGPRGFPVDRDRFFLLSARAAFIGTEERRTLHPSFAAFNAADEKPSPLPEGWVSPRKQAVIRGNIVHATQAECFAHCLQAQILPGMKAHPKRAPHCIGDGITAQRWDAKTSEYTPIACPHELCEYRQGSPDGKTGPACKPKMHLLFRLRWPDNRPEPSLLVRYASAAWSTTTAFAGLFAHFFSQAEQMGIPSPSLYGLPIVLTLSEETSGSGQERRRFPVVRPSIDFDIIKFLGAQQGQLRELGVAPRARLITVGEEVEEDPGFDLVSGPALGIPGGG